VPESSNSESQRLALALHFRVADLWRAAFPPCSAGAYLSYACRYFWRLCRWALLTTLISPTDDSEQTVRHYERTKLALYWTAVSLIVCEGLPLEQAARRMGIDDEQLKDILHRRTLRLDHGEPDVPSSPDAVTRPIH
jgi:hypothetical protein